MTNYSNLNNPFALVLQAFKSNQGFSVNYNHLEFTFLFPLEFIVIYINYNHLMVFRVYQFQKNLITIHLSKNEDHGENFGLKN